MTKIRFNRLLSVVLALVMLATMMSFVFTANAATTEAKKPINVNNWTDLGLVDAVPNAYFTTVTQNATNIYSEAGGQYTADYAIDACKVFDLSGGFTFTWSMGDNGWNDNYSGDETSRAYNAISIGGITVVSQRSGLGDGKGKVYVIKNEAAAAGNSNRVISAFWWERNAQVSVFGSVLASQTGLAGANNVKAYSLTVSAERRLSLTVAGTTICSDIDVSDVDFSDATFSFKSGISYSGGSKYTKPSLTYKKAVKLVDNSVNTLTGLDLTSANLTVTDTSVTPSFSADDKTFSASNAWRDNWAKYKVEGNKTFDLSCGFTFNWDMGDNGGNETHYNKNVFLNKLSIGDLTIKSQRNDDSGTTSTITVYNGSTVITRNASVPNSNKVKNYSMTVADGKLTLSVTYNNVTTVVFGNEANPAVDVSAIAFSAAKFTALSSPGWSGGFQFKINQLTYQTEVPDRNNFVVTKDGQGFVKCNGKNWIDHDVDAGTQVILTAEAAYGYTFQGWVNGVNNTVVSTDPTLTVRANTTNNYTAVFVKNSGTYTVTVLNLFGKFVDTPASVAAGGIYTLPAAVNVTGYTFQGWQVKDSEDDTIYAADTEYTVNGNVIFVPVYNVVETPTTYNISVTGGVETTIQASYNQLVTVHATDTENFSYWKKNDVIVSYNSTYSFYAGLAGDERTITLVAVCDGTTSPVPVTNIVDKFSDTKKVTFLMERSVPDGYSLVESGFILAKAAFGTDDYMSAVNGTTVIKVAASNTSANGQYMLNVKTNASGVQVYAVSYVTYVDASGKLHTVYSTAASATAQ